MTWFVQSSLVNEPFSDPGLLVHFWFGRRALLFDLGDNTPLSPRQLLRVTHAFVSHAHMDHFSGFDRLLRVCLHRTIPLHLVGPADFADRVEHKLKGYTLNLLNDRSCDFVIHVAEFGENGFDAAYEFRAREAFRRRAASHGCLPPGILHDEDEFRVEGAVLDHGIPCLAFAFQEKVRINVWSEGLRKLRLPIGPWLKEAKRAVRRGEPDDTRIVIHGDLSVPLGMLKHEALRSAPGQRIAYVADAAFHDRNVERIVTLAKDADQLFIEAPFLEMDADIAAQRGHLTAHQAGDIARRAGAARFIPFHFSARYREREDELRSEAEQAFRG